MAINKPTRIYEQKFKQFLTEGSIREEEEGGDFQQHVNSNAKEILKYLADRNYGLGLAKDLLNGLWGGAKDLKFEPEPKEGEGIYNFIINGNETDWLFADSEEAFEPLKDVNPIVKLNIKGRDIFFLSAR